MHSITLFAPDSNPLFHISLRLDLSRIQKFIHVKEKGPLRTLAVLPHAVPMSGDLSRVKSPLRSFIHSNFF